MLNYNWNISNWINKLLPIERKTVINHSWIKALLSPVQTLQDEFSAKCTDLDFKVKFSSQQQVLAGMLNLLFDSTLKRIRIETIADLAPDAVLIFDSEGTEGAVIYFDSESPDGAAIYFDDEESLYDFNVYIPTALSVSEAKIISWINRYKLADKTFQIIYI